MDDAERFSLPRRFIDAAQDARHGAGPAAVNMTAWYRDLNANTPCTDCGGIFHPAAMTWDHLPGYEKVDNVGAMLTRHSRAKLLREIAKCELVCANCHAVRSYERRRGVAQPG